MITGVEFRLFWLFVSPSTGSLVSIFHPVSRKHEPKKTKTSETGISSKNKEIGESSPFFVSKDNLNTHSKSK